MKYEIKITEDAKIDLSFFKKHEQKSILRHIQSQLEDEPLTPTKNKKPLRENPIASWELRMDQVRIFYDVKQEVVTVYVISVGKKEHNRLYIRGQEVEL